MAHNLKEPGPAQSWSIVIRDIWAGSIPLFWDPLLIRFCILWHVTSCWGHQVVTPTTRLAVSVILGNHVKMVIYKNTASLWNMDSLRLLTSTASLPKSRSQDSHLYQIVVLPLSVLGLNTWRAMGRLSFHSKANSAVLTVSISALLIHIL